MSVSKLVAISGLIFGLQSTLLAADAPDKILVDGTILTMTSDNAVAQAIALSGSRIIAVGTNSTIKKLAGPRTKVIELGGRTVIPGLIDTHLHAIRGGQTYQSETYWYDAKTLQAALGELKDSAAKKGPGKWVTVAGSWSPEQFTEKRAPTVQELNAALPQNPAYLQYLFDYAIVNDKGAELLGLNKPDVSIPGIQIERDSQGRPTGKLLGNIGSFSFLFNKITASTPGERLQSLQAYFLELNRRGVTGIVDAAGGGSGAEVYDPLFELWSQKRLSLRVAYRVSAQAPGNEAAWFANTTAYMPSRFGDDMLKFLGVGEILVFKANDGVRLAPGFSAPEDGREELYKVAVIAAHRKYPLEVHAYTNDSAKQILDIFERIAKTVDLHPLRWCMTHVTTGTAETFERMKRLGLCYTVQMGPYYEGSAIAQTNGIEAAEQAQSARVALDAGLVVAGGTDSTRIGEYNAWRAIEYQVTGLAVGGSLQRRKELNLTRMQALRLYTSNAAWISFDENSRGSLEVGKQADIAVLDQPYLTIPMERIHTLKSLFTMVGGVVMHADPSFQKTK
jgi:predicted amidohydrolase YtcJ